MRKFTFLAIFMIEMVTQVLNNPGFSQVPFTPGNVVVLRAGDGAAALSTLSTQLFLDEFTPAGTLAQTIVIPTTGVNRLTIVGNATTEGQMTLSPDGYFLTLPGYDAGPGIASIGTTSAADNNRKLLRIDNRVNYYPILSFTAFSGTNIRSAVCNGNDYWASGSSGGIAGTNGVQYFGNGTPGQVSSTITNIRNMNIFNNQLYFTSTIGTFGVYAVGTGLPVTGPQTATIVLPTGTILPNAFSFNAEGNICYIADDRTTGAGGVHKWVNTGGTWAVSYTFSLGASTGAKGLTVDWSGPNPVIYATTIQSPTIAANKLVRIEDVGSSSAFTVLSYAAANTHYRSVAFAPVAEVISAPTIQAHDISFTDIESTGMTVNWVNGNGTKRILMMNTSNSFTNPLNGTDPVADSVYTGPGEQVVYNGSGNSVSVTGLTGSTTYWFRVYEYNGAGDTTKFLTTTATLNPGSQTTLATEPASHVTGFTATSGGTTSVDLTWTAGATGADGYLILQKTGVTAPTGVPVDATAYLTGAPLGDGIIAAIVSSGTALSQTISDLTPGTPYAFTIFPFAWNGSNAQTYNYYTATPVPADTATTDTPPYALFYDGFTGTGNIGGTGAVGTGNNGWTTHSGTGTIEIITGSLNYTPLQPSTGNRVTLPGSSAVSREVNAAISMGTSTVAYYSFLLNVTDPTQISPTTPDYFMHFGSTSGSSVSSTGGLLGIQSVNEAANFRLSIQNTTTDTPAFTEFAQDLDFGTTYLVVVKYDRSSTPTVATLWVNPSALGGTEPAGSVSSNIGTGLFAQFGSVCIRNAVATPRADIDEVRAGNTWADVTPPAVPPTLVVQDVTVENGQSQCYDATQTIYVAGNGTSFVVQDGGTANMIAGQNIIFYPQTTVQSGGYLHGSIAPGGPFCGGYVPSNPAVISGDQETAFNSASSSFKIYPNPTTGTFTLEFQNDQTEANVIAEIYGMHGEKVLVSVMTGVRKQLFSLAGLPSGIYCVRIVAGERTETAKLIKQ